ncbi:hypothetical protein [Glaciihabitans sp. GrIS 2.15]|uniref:hypothetical protein n=1 Tax=Glaciihabitans sp. GrIS 2.15 TaxID=3071710 RepID=UPI002DFBD293|nr:hypothetical protein [Glaciihabitans sp. GrIS 2.15]
MSRALEERTTDTQTSNHRMIAVDRRVAVGLGLASVAAIHILDLPGKFAETPYLAAFYVALIIASFVLTERLFVAGTRRDFLAAAALSAAVIVGFTINRTVGMPGATGDIGNWLEPLGLLSIVVEAFVLWQSIAAVVGMPRKAR